MQQPVQSHQLRAGQRVEGHFLGRGFRGVIDGRYSVATPGIVEIHVCLDAPIKVAGKELADVCLWLNPGCEMYSDDGRSLLGALTTVWLH